MDYLVKARRYKQLSKLINQSVNLLVRVKFDMKNSFGFNIERQNAPQTGVSTTILMTTVQRSGERCQKDTSNGVLMVEHLKNRLSKRLIGQVDDGVGHFDQVKPSTGCLSRVVVDPVGVH